MGNEVVEAQRKGCVMVKRPNFTAKYRIKHTTVLVEVEQDQDNNIVSVTGKDENNKQVWKAEKGLFVKETD